MLLYRFKLKGKKKSLSFELQKLFKDLESNTKSATKSATTHGVTNALEIGNGKLLCAQVLYCTIHTGKHVKTVFV